MTLNRSNTDWVTYDWIVSTEMFADAIHTNALRGGYVDDIQSENWLEPIARPTLVPI